MKISVDDQELFTLTNVQKQVIQNDVSEDIFEEDMKRRLKWVLTHKYECCFEALKKEWEPKLKNSGITFIPTDKDEFAAAVFAHPAYKSRKLRDLDDEQGLLTPNAL